MGNQELDEILNIEPKRSVASVAPIAFFIGSAMGGILAVFGTLYASFAFDSVANVADAGSVADQAESSFMSRWLDGPSTRITEPTRSRDASAGVTDLVATDDSGRATVADIEFGDADATATMSGAALSTEAIELVGETALQRDLDDIRAQLRAREGALERANADRQRLRKEIAVLSSELQVTERLLENAREDAIYNRWVAFLEGAKNTVCGKYARNKSDRCRAAVKSALLNPSNRERFAYCLRSRQPEPIVSRLPRGELPPSHADMIDDTDRTTRDWMVVFCDETLPIDPDGPLANRGGATALP